MSNLSSRFWCLFLCFILGLTSVQCKQSFENDSPKVSNSSALINSETNSYINPAEKFSFEPVTFKNKEQAIIEAFQKLDKGVFFSNIPSQMKVGDTVIIEAGVLKDKMDATGLILDGSGKIAIEEEISFNPMALEIDLQVNPAEFSVKAISSGNKPAFTSNGTSEKWKWEITPQTSGIRNIILIAKVPFKFSQSESVYKREIAASTKTISVKSNYSQTLSYFFKTHWLKLVIVIFAPIIGIYFWYFLVFLTIPQKLEKLFSGSNRD